MCKCVEEIVVRIIRSLNIPFNLTVGVYFSIRLHFSFYNWTRKYSWGSYQIFKKMLKLAFCENFVKLNCLKVRRTCWIWQYFKVFLSVTRESLLYVTWRLLYVTWHLPYVIMCVIIHTSDKKWSPDNLLLWQNWVPWVGVLFALIVA